MADKEIVSLPESGEVTDDTLFVVYQPGAAEPAQKLTAEQLSEYTGKNNPDIQSGYYTPTISQPTEGSMRVEYTPSTDTLPEVQSVTIDLPEGERGPQGVSGVYVGSGEMPDGYNVQIDPDGSETDLVDLVAQRIIDSGELDDIVGENLASKAYVGEQINTHNTDGSAHCDIRKAVDSRVRLDGLSSMTGPLKIEYENTHFECAVHHDGSGGIANLITRAAGEPYWSRRLRLHSRKTRPDIANALEFVDERDGGKVFYPILHTGNKPSGTYTGVGDMYERLIEIGGIGNFLIVQGDNSVMFIATPYGAVAHNFTTAQYRVFNSSAVSFSGGVLKLQAADSEVNQAGTIFSYQVL